MVNQNIVMDDIIMIWLNYNLPLVIVKTFFSEIYFLEPMNPYSVSGILLIYQNWLSLNSFWVNITSELEDGPSLVASKALPLVSWIWKYEMLSSASSAEHALGCSKKELWDNFSSFY